MESKIPKPVSAFYCCDWEFLGHYESVNAAARDNDENPLEVSNSAQCKILSTEMDIMYEYLEWEGAKKYIRRYKKRRITEFNT